MCPASAQTHQHADLVTRTIANFSYPAPARMHNDLLRLFEFRIPGSAGVPPAIGKCEGRAGCYSSRKDSFAGGAGVPPAIGVETRDVGKIDRAHLIRMFCNENS